MSKRAFCTSYSCVTLINTHTSPIIIYRLNFNIETGFQVLTVTVKFGVFGKKIEYNLKNDFFFGCNKKKLIKKSKKNFFYSLQPNLQIQI